MSTNQKAFLLFGILIVLEMGVGARTSLAQGMPEVLNGPSPEICKLIQEKASQEYQTNFKQWDQRFQDEVHAREVVAVLNDYQKSFTPFDLERIKFVEHGTISQSELLERFLKFRKKHEWKDCGPTGKWHRLHEDDVSRSTLVCLTPEMESFANLEEDYVGYKDEVLRSGEIRRRICQRGEDFDEGFLTRHSNVCKTFELWKQDSPVAHQSITLHDEDHQLQVCRNEICASIGTTPRSDGHQYTFEEVYGHRERYLSPKDYVQGRMTSDGCKSYWESTLAGQGASSVSTSEKLSVVSSHRSRQSRTPKDVDPSVQWTPSGEAPSSSPAR
ncbi:hypothetical protein WDW37_08650 [Bdellovibrionota bacterium FG-1]